MNDTIVAISTAAGTGALAVVRLSGSEAIGIASRIFMPKNLFKTLSNVPAQSAVFGRIVDGKGEIVDEVVVTKYNGPRSFTMEDMVEISCHGSLYIQSKILRLLIENGARMATPGEFTKRAFINGRLDLTQAEAIADIIGAKSEAAHKLAIKQLNGAVSEKLTELREKLVHLASLLELELDFADHEDVEFADRTELLKIANETRDEIARLCGSFEQGNAIKNGIAVAIVGEPNVGKSTLLNRLAGDDVAIVSAIAGTTRDSIEREVVIRGRLFRFIDTAGIHETEDEIEKMGIERTMRAIEKAQVVLEVVVPGEDVVGAVNGDGSHIRPFGSEYENRPHLPFGSEYENRPHLPVVNKIDTAAEGYVVPEGAIAISAESGENIEGLIDALIAVVGEPMEDVTITNARHYEVLLRALEAIERVIEGLDGGVPSDLVAQDLRECTGVIAEVTGGEITADEVLGNIFSKFCIGK